jgi:hypothetical protein
MRKYVAIQPSSCVGSSEFAYYSSGYLESKYLIIQISSALGCVTFSTIGVVIALVKVRSGDLSRPIQMPAVSLLATQCHQDMI